MEKINFENLPSTNTPINAENLNQMQLNAEIEIDKLKSIVFDETITNQTSSVNIENLDILRDDSIYDILIIGETTEVTDIFVRINNDAGEYYYSIGQITANTGTTDQDFSPYAGLRTKKNRWYYGHSMRTHQTIIEGTFVLGSSMYPQYNYSSSCCWGGESISSKCTGTFGKQVDNITSINLSCNTGNFKTGTRILLFKRLKNDLINNGGN